MSNKSNRRYFKSRERAVLAACHASAKPPYSDLRTHDTILCDPIHRANGRLYVIRLDNVRCKDGLLRTFWDWGIGA